MTNKQILKYFEKRPGASQLFMVGAHVFVDLPTAEKYAGQVGGLVTTKLRNEVEAAAGNEEDFPVAPSGNDEETTKEEAEKKLASMLLSQDTDYYEMKGLINLLEIPTEGKSKDAYLAALINHKATKENEGGTGQDEGTEQQ
ncbi:MAG: hypothetical protein RBU23_12920 [Candidatus Auribacterota bacterium]|jgi:hypothetical protein|nr:hypothetical protein [Candidatus Auribacterota bacterium]